MNVTEQPPQPQLPSTIGVELRDANYAVDIDAVALLELEPRQRTNVYLLSGLIGDYLRENLSEHERASMRDMYTRYRSLVEPGEFNKGLFYALNDRRITGKLKSPHAVRIVGAPATAPKQGAVDTEHMAVAMGNTDLIIGSPQSYYARQEGKIIARHMAKHKGTTNPMAANSRAAEEICIDIAAREPSFDKKIAELRDTQASIAKLQRDARIGWRTAFGAQNLDGYRRLVDTLIHEVVNIACVGLGAGPEATEAAHVGVFANLYLSQKAERRRESWSRYTGWLNYYMESVEGKVVQSKLACREQYHLRIDRVEDPERLKLPKNLAEVSEARA